MVGFFYYSWGVFGNEYKQEGGRVWDKFFDCM